MALKVLIVDDEFPARQELRWILEEIGNLDIVGEFSNGQAALDFIEHNKVDVVFLDIEMPLLNGLTVAEKVGVLKITPKIVFSTGFSEFAIKAFELNAADYVLKPYTRERLEITIARLTRKQSEETKDLDIETYKTKSFSDTLNPVRLAVWFNDRLLLIEPENEILFFKSENRKTLIYTKKDVLETPLLLKDLEERFGNRGFIRVHKSFIVNASMIKEILPWFNDTYVLKLKDYAGEDVPVSRHFLHDFKQFMQI